MTQAQKLINWSEVSRFVINGDRNGIRSYKVPKKHQETIDDLIKRVEHWISWVEDQKKQALQAKETVQEPEPEPTKKPFRESPIYKGKRSDWI